jgi:hypothetical protein
VAAQGRSSMSLPAARWRRCARGCSSPGAQGRPAPPLSSPRGSPHRGPAPACRRARGSRARPRRAGRSQRRPRNARSR